MIGSEKKTNDHQDFLRRNRGQFRQQKQDGTLAASLIACYDAGDNAMAKTDLDLRDVTRA